MSRKAFEEWAKTPPPENWWDISEAERLRMTWQAATAAALERAALVRMKLPPAKYGENASTIQCVYQDAFDRGWKAGISAMRSSIRALKDDADE